MLISDCGLYKIKKPSLNLLSVSAVCSFFQVGNRRQQSTEYSSLGSFKTFRSFRLSPSEFVL